MRTAGASPCPTDTRRGTAGGYVRPCICWSVSVRAIFAFCIHLAGSIDYAASGFAQDDGFSYPSAYAASGSARDDRNSVP